MRCALVLLLVAGAAFGAPEIGRMSAMQTAIGGMPGAGLSSGSFSASLLAPGATGSDLTLSTLTVTTATNAITMSGGNIFDISSGGYTGFVFNNTVTDKATGIGFLSHASNGTDAYKVDTNGARFHFGAGASDYASSDGTVVNFAGPIGTSGNIYYFGGVTNGAYLQSTGTNDLYLGTGNGARLHVNTTLGPIENSITTGTAASGTGITAVYSSAIRTFVHKVTVINTALAAAATSDVTLAVTPSNTRINRVTANVTQVFTGGALTAVTVQCGKTAGGTEYLLANSVFTAQNTWGDVVAEMGAGLVDSTRADFGTSSAGVPGAITVQCRFTCTTANCNAATQGSVTFYVEGTSYQ